MYWNDFEKSVYVTWLVKCFMDNKRIAVVEYWVRRIGSISTSYLKVSGLSQSTMSEILLREVR